MKKKENSLPPKWGDFLVSYTDIALLHKTIAKLEHKVNTLEIALKSKDEENEKALISKDAATIEMQKQFSNAISKLEQSLPNLNWKCIQSWKLKIWKS